MTTHMKLVEFGAVIVYIYLSTMQAGGSSQGYGTLFQLRSNVKANCGGSQWPVSTHSLHRQPLLVPIFGVQESCSKEGKKYLGPTCLKSFCRFAIVSLLDTHQWARQSSIDSIAHTFPVTTQCRQQHFEGTGKNNRFRWWPYVAWQLWLLQLKDHSQLTTTLCLLAFQLHFTYTCEVGKRTGTRETLQTWYFGSTVRRKEKTCSISVPHWSLILIFKISSLPMMHYSYQSVFLCLDCLHV